MSVHMVDETSVDTLDETSVHTVDETSVDTVDETSVDVCGEAIASDSKVADGKLDRCRGGATSAIAR